MVCYTTFGETKNNIQFAERYDYDGGHLAIHALLEPYKDGTLIVTEVGSLTYYKDSGYEFVSVDNKASNRVPIEQFQRILNLLKEQEYGRYDYGIVLGKKDESGEVFHIVSLNQEYFQGVQEANLLAIDGIPAKKLFIEDIELMTTYGNGEPRSFTLQTTDGEKTVMVNPKLDTKGKKALETLKIKTYKGLPYKGEVPRSTIFDPLQELEVQPSMTTGE